MGFSKMVDLELSDDAKLDYSMPISMPDKPHYPYEMRIALTDETLDKLGLDCDCDIGDILDFRAFGEVTSVSKSDGHRRVEVQLIRMKVENESTETEDD